MKYIPKYQKPPGGLYRAGTKEYDINSPEYRNAYNSGHLTRYNASKDTYNATPLEGVTITAKAKPTVLQEWGKYAAEHADASSPGGAMLSTITSAAQLPQLMATKLFSGKVQTPSEALNIKNKVGGFAANMILDPLNLVGVGLASKAMGIKNPFKLKGITLQPKNPNQISEAPTSFFSSFFSFKPKIEESLAMKHQKAHDVGEQFTKD